ncbi:MAG: ParA family protein [Acidobacteriota bacterium]|nr:ParA family protein [Acidobacteriota bacterium]
MKSIVLFNNKGGVGKTTLTFNIAHMMSRAGLRTVVLDYDPQCNISAVFLSEDRLVELWEDEAVAGQTVVSCIDLVRRGRGDVLPPRLVQVTDDLWLLPGHLGLSRFEQTLAVEWPQTSASDNERALDVTTALDVLANLAAKAVGADVVLVDVGPSLGALNRAALLACDAVVVPLAPDLFSLQGLKNVGPTLREWRSDWVRVRERHLGGRPQQNLPPHDFRPIGYIMQQHLARSDRPVAAYGRWADQIPAVFHEYVLGEEYFPAETSLDADPQCIAKLKHFASLVPIAQLARKPMFDLKQADGIGGGQIQSVAKCRAEFKALVEALMRRLAIGQTIGTSLLPVS